MEKKQPVFQDYIVPASDFLVLANRPSLTMVYPANHDFSKSVAFDSLVRVVVLSNPDFDRYVNQKMSDKEFASIKPKSVEYLDVNSIRQCRFRSVGTAEWDANYGPTDPHQFLDWVKWGPNELDHEVKVYLLKWVNKSLQSLNAQYGYERVLSPKSEFKRKPNK